MSARLKSVRHIVVALATFTCVSCGSDAKPTPPMSPTPPGGTTANVYILPDAVKLGANAFGDDPIVIYKGETMHWKNIDGDTHAVVADTPNVPDFMKTNTLAPGGEQSFVMKIGRAHV